MKGILTWHSIDESKSVVTVSRDQFERQVDWLASSTIRVVPLTSILALPLDTDAIALTFDDGLSSFAKIAAPLLRDRGLPATVFVVPGFVGRASSWTGRNAAAAVPQFPVMSWDEIREVSAAGFDIGGHGMTHRPLKGLTDTELRSEIDECASVIEASIGRSPETFAYPYGDHDISSVTAAGRIFSVGCTTRFGTLAADSKSLELPRLDMYYFRGNKILEAWGTPRFSAYFGLRKAGRAAKATIDGMMSRDG